MTIKYSVIGDPTYGGSNSFACAILPSQTANNDMGADSMASVYMHELAESVTDWNADAWYFDGGCPWAGGYLDECNNILNCFVFLIPFPCSFFLLIFVCLFCRRERNW